VDIRSVSDGINGIGVGPAIILNGFPTAVSRMKASGSISLNEERRARFRGVVGDRRPVGFQLQADYEYRLDRSFFGIGNDTRETDRSYYRLETTRVEAGAFYGVSPLQRVRLLGGYSGMSPGRASSRWSCGAPRS
jgi:hypothetical protein